MNNCMLTRNIPKIWRKTRIIALLKPGKDPAYAKSIRPISLLCHLYKLFERLILNRLGLAVEPASIPQQAGFRPGKSTTSQLLNLTQHIEDGFQKGLVTGAVFVDLSAAYDTVNHRLLLKKNFGDDKKTWPSQTSLKPSSKTGASMLFLTTSKAAGDNSETACLKVVCWLHYYITSTQMTSQWTRTLNGLSTLTISV